ncbi:MAG: hypothetical protein JO180_00705 [Gemmatirosa sp.]|nr:hypothetical protein [Gemmatirosa sp.]
MPSPRPRVARRLLAAPVAALGALALAAPGARAQPAAPSHPVVGSLEIAGFRDAGWWRVRGSYLVTPATAVAAPPPRDSAESFRVVVAVAAFDGHAATIEPRSGVFMTAAVPATPGVLGVGLLLLGLVWRRRALETRV